ncbi:uncharacterized protein LOC115885664 [Sitophilus oryzae]|uniref:Uncharacterized protein LOC115885664 n=1 Tax=Sitophilus oryzae TaxID=7048 RepID=A0A6J2YB80_SITOR|nr:uncharacterized protein LOC115885664 [Sitophilus oryzae]
MMMMMMCIEAVATWYSEGVGAGIERLKQEISLPRVADALKISLRTVSSIKMSKDRNELPSTPGKNRPRKKCKTQDLNEGLKMEVRNILYDLYAQKKQVTINKLNEELRRREIVDISYGSLRTLLFSLGFKYKKDDNRRALMETSNIASMRAAFFRKYMGKQNSAISSSTRIFR